MTWTAGYRANMSALGFERRTEVEVTFQAGGVGEGEGGVRMMEARDVVMASMVRGWAVARCWGDGSRSQRSSSENWRD